MSLEIKTADYQEQFELIKHIRTEVFQKEQKVPYELEFDGQDNHATHFLAYLNKGAVGTLRIRNIDEKTVKIERLAVLSQFRNQGIGTKMMEKALEIIKIQDYSTGIVHAQEYIKDMYLKLGFIATGKIFEEAGIPHIKMIKNISK
ncbi:MAG: GNAT family N-acetyltransferase [Pleurocapsa sp.]